MSELKNKVALVTNVHEFAGPGSVSALLRDGMIVVVHDRRFAEETARSAYSAEVPGAHVFSEQDPEQLVEAVLRQFGKVDVLVSNDVVKTRKADVEDIGIEEFRRAVEDGMVWPYRLAHALIPGMKDRRSGSIIFVTSGTAIQPMAGSAMYSAVRAGTTAFAISLAKEAGASNVQVNAIGPNWFQSDTYFPPQRTNSSQVQRSLAEDVPIRRLGTQEELGALVSLLASQKAMPITGQIIAFAGGYY